MVTKEDQTNCRQRRRSPWFSVAFVVQMLLVTAVLLPPQGAQKGVLTSCLRFPGAEAAGRKYGTPKQPINQRGQTNEEEEQHEQQQQQGLGARRRRRPSNIDLGMDIDVDDLDELTEADDADEDPVGRAWKVTQEALKLANNNQLALAMPKFVQATEWGPHVAQFWNNLGVTEMRMGKLKAAYKHFNKAINVDPKDKAPRSNLDDLLSFLRKPHGASMLSSDRSAEDIPQDVLHPDTFEDDDEDFDLDELLPRSERGAASSTGSAEQQERPLEDVEDFLERGRVFKGSGSAPPREGEQRRDKNQPPVKANNGIQHTVRYLPRVSVHDLYKPENFQYRTAQKPFILTNVTTLPGWENRQYKKWSFEYFMNYELRSAIVDFYPHNMERENVAPYMTPLEEAMEELQSSSGKYPRSKYRPGQYVQWNMNTEQWKTLKQEIGPLPDILEMDDNWFQGCLEDEKLISQYYIATHWSMLLAGNKGAGMFNHWDILKTSSWQFQARGSKRWHLCPPSEIDKMYDAGAVDSFHPDYKAYPLFKNADCYLDTVKEGEVIFYQKDYWHQTENLDDQNFALSGTSVDWVNHHAVSNELVSECSGSTRRLTMLTGPLCKKLFNCYEWWRHAYAGEYKGDSPTQQNPGDLGRAKGVGTFESLGVCPDE